MSMSTKPVRSSYWNSGSETRNRLSAANSMARHRTSRAAILGQIPVARAREAQTRRSGLRAKTARYDAASERFVLELTNGCAFIFPARLVAGLSSASAEERAG